MAVVIKGSGSIEGSTGLEMGANGTTEIRGQINVALGSSVAGISTASGTVSSGISTATNFAPTLIPTSNRNLIINGACNVAQRATTQSTHTAAGFFTVDRIYTSIGGEDEGRTEDQISLTSSDTGPWAKGFRNAFQVTNGDQSSAVGASDYLNIVIKNEAQDLANSGWDYTSASSYITLSFWVKSSVAQNFYGFLKTTDGTSQYYTFETGSLSANTWTKITKTIPGDSNITFDNNNGQGLSIEILPFLGTTWTDTRTLNTWSAWAATARTPNNTTTWWETDNATFAITGLQLEVGSVATPFEHRSFGEELARCQRYYFKFLEGTTKEMSVGWFYTGAWMSFILRYPTTMRAAPTGSCASGTNYYIIYSNNSSDYFDDFAFENGSTEQYSCYNNSDISSTQGQAGIVRSAHASSKIEFSAEL